MKANQTFSLPANSFELIDVEYIRPDRTIEIILVKPHGKNRNEKLVYLYNYEGYHFRIFSSLIELSNFLQGEDFEILAEFDKDEDVDKFLSTFSINCLYETKNLKSYAT